MGSLKDFYRVNSTLSSNAALGAYNSDYLPVAGSTAMRNHVHATRQLSIAAVLLIALLSVTGKVLAQSWTMSGQSATDLRSQPSETKINTSNVNTLAPKWVFGTGGDVSATPTVVGNVVYVPDWSGHFYALNAATGAVIWTHQIAEYDGISGSIARGSPAFYNNELIIGDLVKGSHNGANVMAVSAANGNLLWITKVDPHPAAIISGPVVVADWRQMRCTRCGGALFTESIDAVVRHDESEALHREVPRRGRPPKWLVEERRRKVDAADSRP